MAIDNSDQSSASIKKGVTSQPIDNFPYIQAAPVRYIGEACVSYGGSTNNEKT